MVIVALPNKVKKINRFFGNSALWCYIGKDVDKRQKIADALGKGTRFYLKERLYKIALEKNQPYLDFVSRLGSEQKDQLNWWASKFASKSPFHTDFFLFVCYEALVKELIEEKDALSAEKLVIFVEDPWLFVEVRNLISDKNVKFVGNPSLILNKFILVVQGLIHRLFLVCWFVLVKSLIRIYHKGEKPEVLKTEKSAICLINPADKTVFKNGEYLTNYTPGLSSFYEEKGFRCFFLYPFPFPLSTVRYIGRNKKILWPLIVDAKILTVFKRMFERWKPVFSSKMSSAINDCQVPYLLERERWITFSKVGFNFNLILHDALDKFLSRGWCSHLIYLFENQPWEKMLCMAATKNRVRTIGYQHSSICKLYISQFIGKGEAAFAPLPDKIVTAGDYFAELYKKGGIPEEKVVVGGAWRYCYMQNNMRERSVFPSKRPGNKRTILVSLPIVGFILDSMLENLDNALFQRHLNDDFEIWLKPHPVTDSSDLARINKLALRYNMAHKPFQELLRDADLVIASSSTSGLESFLYGKRVICYLPENFIVPDPLLDIENEKIYKWYEGEEFNKDFLGDSSSLSNLPDLEVIRNRYFAKISCEAWLNFVTNQK